MTQAKSISYPAQYVTDAVLKDGSIMRLRPVKPDDAAALFAFISNVIRQPGYARLHQLPEKISPEDAARYCTVDYDNTVVLVGEVTAGGRPGIVALGRYFRLPKMHSAELDLIIIDSSYRGKGVGTKMVETMAAVARDHDITHFEAAVKADNKQMMDVFLGYGFHVESELTADEYHVQFPIGLTRKVTSKEEARERTSSINSISRILSAKSVAVIGASRSPNTLGHIVLRCILQNNYSGTVYPVNPNAPSIMSVRTYKSILDVPDDVEVAVILVPARLVARTVDECGRKGVHSIIVISDGFKERGPEGAARELELRNIALGYGMRLIGPNCMGIINTNSEISLNATFSPVNPPQGNVGFLSQSGAMGLAILKEAYNLNIGISSFFSLGNRADVSAEDLMRYWEHDNATKVILLYMESFGDPRQFARIARRVSARKPIVVVKSGNTAAGSRAAASHTGALATSDTASDVLFRHAGIIRVNAMEELFDMASLLSTQPFPRGRRLVVVTNGGGPGIIAADAASRNGLELQELSPETTAKIKDILKRDITIGNPVDTTAGATSEDFEQILKVLADDDENDAVLVIFIPPFIQTDEGMQQTMRKVAPVFWKCKKPVLSCFLANRGFKEQLRYKGRAVPNFSFPEEAVAALAKAVDYAETRRKSKGSVPHIKDLKCDDAQNLIHEVMTSTAQRPLWLGPEEITRLLNCYGINVAIARLAKTPEEAVSIAREMGFPVAVKLSSPTITHKTDVGGVITDVTSEAGVRQAYHAIRSRLVELKRQDEMEGVQVQRMVKGGIETIVGVTHDPSFGPLMMFGSGGVYAEMAKDVTLKLHPLTDVDAAEMIRSVKISRLFDGFRGAPPADTEALEELLLRVSAMVEDNREIAELDLNPVMVMPRGEGYRVIDARVLIK